MPELKVLCPMHRISIFPLMLLALLAACSSIPDGNKEAPAPSESFCMDQADKRAARMTGADLPRGSGGESLSGVLTRMDALDLRERLYKECIDAEPLQEDGSNKTAPDAQ